MRISRAIFLVFPLLACGCVIPIPTPEWGDEPITREQFDVIEQGAGRLTRDEVESMLGSPQQNYAEGRVVVYIWTRNQGVWIVGVPAGFGGYGDVAAGESEHRLCLLFDENGILERSEHVDSALGMADSMVADILNDWLREASAAEAAPGYARPIEVERFEMAPRDGAEIGIMLYAESERQPSCWKELDSFDVAGYRLYTHGVLRDAFYPWFEPSWYDNLPTIAGSEGLAEARRASGLRFIIVVSNRNGRFAAELCSTNNPYRVSCYDIRYRDESGRIALLDLEGAELRPPAGRSTVETLKIPEFPTSRRQACKALMVYAAADISMLAGPNREAEKARSDDDPARN